MGWVFFVKGAAPLFALVPYGQAMPERPTSPGNDGTGKAQNFRQGFRVPVAGKALGGVRELAGQSAALINGLNELHSAYEASPEAAMGKIPVVRMTRTDAIKSGQATNYQPVSKWSVGGSARRARPAHRSGATRPGKARRRR